ncbi:hypothetical protein GOP47_0023023 [Adiantum capillus-veneris]|uniref:Uncharacterized protein n=1 Tax=Adiantum capillus-veneris TaxID=13818 RepID=A0A9D4Z5W3_ADICA|nr:hypothetical protein GOP47_0023023 [Adiantum capillus-veneris]
MLLSWLIGERYRGETHRCWLIKSCGSQQRTPRKAWTCFLIVAIANCGGGFEAFFSVHLAFTFFQAVLAIQQRETLQLLDGV